MQGLGEEKMGGRIIYYHCVAQGLVDEHAARGLFNPGWILQKIWSVWNVFVCVREKEMRQSQIKKMNKWILMHSNMTFDSGCILRPRRIFWIYVCDKRETDTLDGQNFADIHTWQSYTITEQPQWPNG